MTRSIEVWGPEAGTIREDLKLIRGKFHGISSAIKAAERGEGVVNLKNVGEMMQEGQRLTQEVINLIGGVD